MNKHISLKLLLSFKTYVFFGLLSIAIAPLSDILHLFHRSDYFSKIAWGFFIVAVIKLILDELFNSERK